VVVRRGWDGNGIRVCRVGGAVGHRGYI
jgi:hypothetical protein